MTFLSPCTALITGASSGLGAEFARQLAPRVAGMVLVARRIERLEALKQELERPGLTIHLYQADLSREAEREALLECLKSGGITVNLLINNAGLGDRGRFQESDWERVRHMIEVNVAALTELTYRLLPTLRQSREAAILNVSSVLGMMPMPKMAVYAATKAYVSSFSEALRAELRGTGVRVTTLCPGPVPTEFGSTAERQGQPDPVPAPECFKVSAQEVVAEALRAVERDRARIIPGWFLALAMLLTAAMPMVLLRLVMRNQAK